MSKSCQEYVTLDDEPTLHFCEREEGHEPPHRVVIEWPGPSRPRDEP